MPPSGHDPADSADPAAMLAELRAAPAKERFALACSWGAACAAGQLPGAALADMALLLLQTLSEDDDILDMQATELLREYGEPRHLEPLRKAQAGLRPRGGFRDWRLEVPRAISAIEARAEGRCECTVDARHGMALRPAGFEVEEERVDTVEYTVTFRVRCLQCRRRWEITERHGYHYPSSYWAALDPAP